MKISPITKKYQGLDMNDDIFTVKITVETESRRTRKNLKRLNAVREDIKPLLGKDWIREFNLTIRHIEKTTTITDQSEKDKKYKL